MNKYVRFLRYSITLLTFLMISGCSKSNTQSVFVRPVEAVGAEDDGVYVYSFNSTNCSAGDYTEEAIANSLETYRKQRG